MAAAERSPADRLSEAEALLAVVEAAGRGGFVELVGLIERLLPSGARVGGAGPPDAEPVRFRHDPSLAFSTGDVSSVRVASPPADPFEAAQAHPRFDVTTTFLGLTGSSSPLPLHLVEEVLHEDPDRPVQRDFLDLFHHRLLSLLYRLLVKYDAAHEFLSTGDDEWSKRLLALGGTDLANGKTPSLPVWRLLRLSPLLATRARNARTLELALADVLSEDIDAAAVEVEEFVGDWITLDPPQRVQLGVANHRLGQEFVLGERVFDRGAKFRVRIGPLARDAYDRLRPSGDLFPVVKEVVGRAIADPLAYDLELVLAIGAAPAFCLSSSGESRLGQNTWLGERQAQQTRVVIDVVD